MPSPLSVNAHHVYCGQEAVQLSSPLMLAVLSLIRTCSQTLLSTSVNCGD